jgi:hypothetical protein
VCGVLRQLRQDPIDQKRPQPSTFRQFLSSRSSEVGVGPTSARNKPSYQTQYGRAERCSRMTKNAHPPGELRSLAPLSACRNQRSKLGTVTVFAEFSAGVRSERRSGEQCTSVVWRPTMTARSHTMASSRKRRAHSIQAVRQEACPGHGARTSGPRARFENVIRGSKVSMDKVLRRAPGNGYIEANERSSEGLLQRFSKVDRLDFFIIRNSSACSQSIKFSNRAAVT